MLPERIRSIRCPPEGDYAALQGKPRGPIRPLPERIGKGVGHAGSQPPRGCLYGAWVLPFTPIHRGQPQCLRQRHSRSPPRRQLGSPLLRHMPRLRPRRRFPHVFVNGMEIARIGDPVACGSAVATGSGDVFANDL